MKGNDNHLIEVEEVTNDVTPPVVARPVRRRRAVPPAETNGAQNGAQAAPKPIRRRSAPVSLVESDFHQDNRSGVLLLEDLLGLKSARDFVEALKTHNADTHKITELLKYEAELERLQIELVRMQHWVNDTGKRIAIVFEGRDAAGKGGTIRRFIEHLNPRLMRVVALPKPTVEETGQWYFQRYMKQLPNRGEIVFFDRSWYNRAVVEPVNGFCSKAQYELFMRQVPEFEHMLYEDGVTLIKFWFSISKEEQLKRFQSRGKNPLKQWKLSPVDAKAQEMWEDYTKYKEWMFSKTHTTFSPWTIVKANNKRKARLESMRYVLSMVDYQGKENACTSLYPDPNIITRFHRSAVKID